MRKTILAPGLALLLGVAGAGAARAQAIGYVTTLGGNVSPVTSFNSAGGTNSVAILGGGQFRVTLPGLGDGLHSNVQVNAVNSNGTPHYCISGGWGSSGTGDVVANVACFTIGGVPANSDFALFYQARTRRPASGKLAFLWADQPTAASYIANRTYSFSSVGGSTSVSRSSAGHYRAFLGEMFAPGGNVQVTAYGTAAARCQVVDWAPDSGGMNVDVLCVNATGAPADAFFTLSYARNTTQAVAAVGQSGGYAFANHPNSRTYKPAFSFNSITTGPLTAQRPQNAFNQPGSYTLIVPNPTGIPFNTFFGMVTSVGSAGEFCNFVEFDTFSTEVDMSTACYDAAGRPHNTKYSATLALGG